MSSVALHVEESAGASLHASETPALALDAGGSMYAVGSPLYTGAHSFTPTGERQVIAIDGKRSDGDITIEPIPSNYGLITYNGSVITVS